MNYLTVSLFLITVMAALLGFTGMAGMTAGGAWIAKGLFLISFVLLSGSVIANLFRWQPCNDRS